MHARSRQRKRENKYQLKQFKLAEEKNQQTQQGLQGFDLRFDNKAGAQLIWFLMMSGIILSYADLANGEELPPGKPSKRIRKQATSSDTQTSEENSSGLVVTNATESAMTHEELFGVTSENAIHSQHIVMQGKESHAQAKVNGFFKVTTPKIEDHIVVNSELYQVLTEEQINFYKNKINAVYNKIRNSSELNRKHIDYVLRSVLKIELIKEDPFQPDNCYYREVTHTMYVSIPYGHDGFKISAIKQDHFDEAMYGILLHEAQHINQALANSDEHCCNPTKKSSDKMRLFAWPKKPKLVSSIIKQSQDKILEDFPLLLEVQEKQKNEKSNPTFFKSKKPTKNEEALAKMQALLKDYHPRRTIVIASPAEFKAKFQSSHLSKLEKGEKQFISDSNNFFYIDQVEQRHGDYYVSGWRVKDPNDKLRAFLEDTNYIQNEMPKLYQSKITPHNKEYLLPAEADAHTYEMGVDLVKAFYPKLVELHDKEKEESQCKLAY